MKNIKKLLAFVAVFAMVLVAVFALAACNEHKCKDECPICHKCTSDCDDPACAEKCANDHTSAHVCHSVCQEPGCGKCTSNCSDPVCANNRCPGHASAHTCDSVCAICGACKNSACQENVCGSKCSGHGPFTGLYVDASTAEKLPYEAGKIVSVKLKGATVSFSGETDLTADATHAYIAVKYSGTATFNEISVYGTKDGGDVKSGVVANILSGWNVRNTVGTDFSVVVAQIGGYYGATELDIDTITNIGFNLTGEANDTFTVHGVELLADENHSLGTPTLPKGQPIGDLTCTSELINVSKAEDGKQTVSFRDAPGYTNVTVQINEFNAETDKYLYIKFTCNDTIKVGLYYTNPETWFTTWPGNDYTAGEHEVALDLTGKDLTAKQLIFLFNANGNPGSEYSAEAPKTVVFDEIAFYETDPTASSEPNHFRVPTGSGVVYSATDGKITYENTAGENWRYLEILLENHDTDFDVLKLSVTGYNGLVMGVRVLFNDIVAGNPVPAVKDVISSGAYYSKIETDARCDMYFYLAADGINGCEVTGVQLYLDAPAGAGTVGAVEITLHSIEMLKSSTLAPAAVTITAEPTVSITAGETPTFNVTLKNAEGTDIEGRVITEYRKKNEEGLFAGNYTAGLPTTAGEYEVRFYYMGSADYNYSRTVTSVLTITGSSEPEQPEEPGEPIVIGDMTKDNDSQYVLTKGEDGAQTVSREQYWGLANTIVNVQNWNPSQKYLVIELQVNGTCALGVATAAQAWPDITGEYLQIGTTERTTLVFDMTGKGFSETDGNIYFHFDGTGHTWGGDLEEGAATTITFYSISFSATNPNEAAGE